MIHGERTLRHLLQPIQPVLDMPGVTEVVCQRTGEIGIEKNGHWTWQGNIPELTFDRLDAIGILSGQMMSKEFDPQHPICLTTLPDGQRYTTARPPVTAQGCVSATIRIPSQTVRTIEDDDFSSLLESANTETGVKTQLNSELIALYRAKDWKQFFRRAVIAKKTILATGATGSGKTTMLKRLMNAVPVDERLVTIEDTDEFGTLPHRNRVSLFYGSAGVEAQDAVELSLRMRPDRIMMQELRGKEAFSFVRAALAGHNGGMTTLHSDKGDDAAFDALAVMVQGHDTGKQIPDDKLKPLLRRLVDVIAWCVKDQSGYQVPYVWFRDAEEAA